MRSFVCAVAVLLLLIGAIAGNCLYVHRVTDALSELVESLPCLPSEDDKTVPQLRMLWDRTLPWIAISVPTEHTHRLEEALLDLEAAVKNEDAALYTRARAYLLYYLRSLHRAEGCSPEEII